ncbi:hypothetical protein H2198_004622 [Neophaeococcomyces mojaviensis]|uniref:Uncharacterized protein n=1 Tax=Neophaeococcomyces mojaviensis TaxID=3383035 RepID=A0ACC3A8E4_9EURO|nr:hypothetical protein H2198_004622 [Knufia sp. JES_112]
MGLVLYGEWTTYCGPTPFTLAELPQLTNQTVVVIIRYSTEYIIMEHVQGSQLAQTWPDLGRPEQTHFIGAVYQKIKGIANADLPV